MGDCNKQICQLCLDKAPASECETIDEIKKAMLEYLLININFDISDCAVACNMCLNRLQESFDFKSRCSTTFVETDNKADMKVFPRSIGNISLGGFQVCCLCMSAPSNEWNGLNDGVLLQEMIKYCFPEMDLNDVNKPAICKPCLNSLKGSHEFLKSCREVERLCQLVTPANADIPILKEFLESKDFEELGKSIIIKKEFSDTENDVNAVTCLKNENIPTIKCEELDIKDETDLGEEIDDSVPSGACNYNSRKGSSLKRKEQVRKSASNGRKHFSSEDHMARHTELTEVLGCHILNPTDNSKEEVHKCVKCEYETNYESYLVRHMTTHLDRNAERKFKCDKCPYETDRMYSLSRHNLTHKDRSEVKLHKCANCEFETRYKSSIIQHMLKHRDPKAEKTYKCDKCPYETEIRYMLGRHNAVHKDKSEVTMHKCENCEFETRYKAHLIRHMLRHHDPRLEKKFKCDICPYETDFKYSLRVHTLRHKDKSEVEMHKCGNCEYETRQKDHLVRHMLRHRDPRAERKFKCGKCLYATDFKDHLRSHNLKHKDKSEVEMHKCEHCEYQTRYKYDTIRHMLKHCDARAKGKS